MLERAEGVMVKPLGAPELVFEIVADARLLVSAQKKTYPSDEEWDLWLAAARKLEEEAGAMRLLVVTEGGHPTKAQLDRLLAANGSNPPTAIVSPSLALRCFGSALGFINPAIRCFAPTKLEKALEHLGLAPSEQPLAIASVRRVERLLASGSAHPSPRLP